MRRIVTHREQAELAQPWQRTADFDEDAFWAKHQQTLQHFRSQADGLQYVTPEPGITMAVGPNWSGSVPKTHPDYIPRETAADDIHGYLHHDDAGYVHFVHTNPNMRQMGVGRKLLDHAGITDTAHSVNMTPDGQKFNDALRRTATPWNSKEGDPTYPVPTSDLIKHRQFNPSPTTPEEMQRTLYTNPWGKGEQPYRNNGERDWQSGGGSEGSQNADDILEAFESGQAHKLPPTEIVTNGYGATLSDGNHRVEVADMMSHPELSSYIHYNPHSMPDDFHTAPVDPESALGKHINTLVQNHPYEPVDGGPTTDHVFRKHPETGQWQRGRVDHSTPPHFVDDDDYAQQMTQSVPGYKHDGLGTYFPVDWGNGPEITHERHLHARRDFIAMGVQEYHGGHESPGPGAGWPVHEMTNVSEELGGVPEDWYTHPQYYSSGANNGNDLADMKRTQKLYNDMRGKPDHPVTVYRALPHGNTSFNTGDWVTPSLNYARQHAMQDDDPANDWPVIKTTVPAKHLFQNGDSYDEFGYHGPSHAGQVHQ